MIRIALVWPRGFLPAYSIPLPYAYLKANIDSSRYEVQVIDCVLDGYGARDPALAQRLIDFKPHIVGVSTWSPMFPEALDVLRVAKELNSKVTTIMGGPHATSYHGHVIQFTEIDFIFRGEADLSFAEFLRQWESPEPQWRQVRGLVYREGDRVQTNEMERAPDLDVIRPPDLEFIALRRYQKRGYRWNSPAVRTAPLWITRGCPYRCQYCAAPQLNGKPVRKHGIEFLMRHIVQLYDEGNRWFNIIDDNFTYDVEFAKEFCRSVIALELEGVGFGTPNGIRMSRGDAELWRLMKAAGWRHLIVAPESGSTHTLQLMKKDLKLESVPRIVHEIRGAGLKVQAFFIIGYPGERPQDLEETAKLIRRCKFNFVFLANFQPLPGTPVYDQLVREMKIEDWLLPHNFSDGARVYTSEELKNFNFSRFLLRMQIGMMLRDPRNTPYQFSVLVKLFRPRIAAKKIALTLWSMIRGSRPSLKARVFRPLHLQSAALTNGNSNTEFG